MAGDFQRKRRFRAELSLPLANGMTMCRKTELGSAACYSNYDTFGGQLTTKAGLTYSPVKEFLHFVQPTNRVQRTQSQRLFKCTADGYPSVSDP